MGMCALVLAAVLQGFVPPSRSVDRGTQSDVSVQREVTVRDADEWAALWRQHAPNRPRPSVDFSREMVVGVFLGTRATAGFAIEIVGARDAGNASTVQYRETTPAPDAITAQVLTSPYHLVAIPKRSGTVRFEKVKT